MPLNESAPQNVFNSLGVIPTEVMGVAINYYANRTPLFSRLPKSSIGSASFKLTNDNYRPNSDVLTAENSDTSTATVTVADTSFYLVGDVLEVDNEIFEVTAITSSTVLAVTRGHAGSTAATHSNGATVYLLGNSRTGAEVNQAATSRVPSTFEQWTQTFQFPYAVGGSLNAKYNYELPPGVATVLGRDRMLCMQNLVDAFEISSYYGVKNTVSATSSRPAQAGLRSLITTNKTTSPTNAGAYKPSDLTRDTLEKCFKAGGNPDTLLVSTDFMIGLTIWGQAIQRIDAGATEFGTPIDAYKAPFLNDVSLVPCPLLRPGTVICLSSDEIFMKVARDMFDKPRGSRGDAEEGDLIMEAAIGLMNQSHHAWVSGITAFSAT